MMLILSNSGRYVRRLTERPSLAREGWFPCILISLSLSFSLNCVSCVSLASLFPVVSLSLVVFPFFFFFFLNKCVYLMECVRAPSEKCAQTLVLGVMLSVLMEVSLSLDSSVFFSSLSVLLRRLFP